MIDRIHIKQLTTGDFQRNYVAKRRPVLITGLLDGVEDWNPDFLTRKFADDAVEVRVHGQGFRDKDKRQWKQNCDFAAMTFGEFAAYLRDGSAARDEMYIGNYVFNHTALGREPILGELERVFGFKGGLKGWNLWCGPTGHRVAMHFDPADGTLCQLHGSKRIFLFPPSEFWNVYPFPLASKHPNASQVNLLKRDLQSFPRLVKAEEKMTVVDLNMGEVLYIPAFWWHEVDVTGTGFTCSVNKFWKFESPLTAVRENAAFVARQQLLALSRGNLRQFIKNLEVVKQYLTGQMHYR